MHKEKPLVSIFLPYYNDETYLEEAINSVLEQTYEVFELFLFNHASTDNSRKIAHGFDDPRIFHVDAEKNLGAGSGYNLAITLSKMKGKYLKLLCADDLLKKDAIENLVNCFIENPDKDIVFSDMDYVDENLKPLNTKWSKEINKVDFHSDEKETLLKIFQGYSHLAFPAAMIKMDAIKDIKLDYTLIMLFDVSLWLKLLIAGKKIVFLDKATVNYRISSQQLSNATNGALAGKRGFFELFQLLNFYLGIKNIEYVKFLCPCKYSELLDDGDEEFIPFIVAYFSASMLINNNCNWFKDQQASREIWGCLKLFELFQNDNYRIKIEEKFGFGIKEFRALYSYMPPIVQSYSSLKQRILNKTARNLSLLQLGFVVGRKLVHCISPFHHIKKFKKKLFKNKQYTV